MNNSNILKAFFLVSCFTLLTMAQAQQKLNEQFVLQGTVANQSEGWVYLTYSNKDGKLVRDSAALKNGSFQFKGAINEPTLAYFNGKMTSRGMDDPNYTSLFLEPAVMKVTVRNGEYKKAILTGSRSQLEYEALQKPQNKIRDRWKVVMDTLSAVNKRSNFQYQELKDWVLRPYNAEIREVQMAFINSHPSSYVTAYTLRFMTRELPEDSLKKMYNRLPEPVKKSVYGKAIATDLEKLKIGVPGTLAGGFTVTDINGQPLSLSDYKGKYVLLDFWASWCLPCRKGNPHLLELYAKYRDKGFEIIGVASDDGKEEAWKKAVAEDKTGVWKHVLSGYDQAKRMRGEKNENHIGEKYNIATLPTKILVDKNGVIIGRYGESNEDVEAMDKKLSEIFGTL